MRCKPGDLAIRVAGANAHSLIPHGSIVRVIGLEMRECDLNDGRVFGGGEMWNVEYQGLRRCPLGFDYALHDSWLRPLRDGDQRDESLSWANVPPLHKEAA